MQRRFEQCATSRLSVDPSQKPISPRPSEPRVTEVAKPVSPTGSTVAATDAEQATFEQCATFRSPPARLRYAISPRPSEPIVVETSAAPASTVDVVALEHGTSWQ